MKTLPYIQIQKVASKLRVLGCDDDANIIDRFIETTKLMVKDYTTEHTGLVRQLQYEALMHKWRAAILSVMTAVTFLSLGFTCVLLMR